MNSKTAILLIDFQNDYLPEGKFPLHNTRMVINNALKIISHAKKNTIPLVHIQHIADPRLGTAPFFNENTEGAMIIDEIKIASESNKIIIKHYADSFQKTNLDQTLSNLGIKKLFLTGMMTQNCVTHTALSLKAINYEVNIISDACTTVSPILHKIAVSALSNRAKVIDTSTFVNY